MTFAEMKAEVFRLLRESSTSPVYWSDEDVEVALNEAYMELSDETEWYEKFQVIDLLDNQPYYDLRTVLRHPFLRLGRGYNKTTQRWMIPTSPSDLDKGDRRWQMRSAEPEFVMLRGLWWLGYWPVTGAAGGQIKQYYKALPPLLSEDDDEPGFHISHHYALVEFALSMLFADDGETDLAWEHFKLYMEHENALTGHTRGRNEIPLKHSASEEV